MKLIIFTIISVVSLHGVQAAEHRETVGQKAGEAAGAVSDAVSGAVGKVGETVESGAEWVYEEAKQLFSDGEAHVVPVKLEDGKITVPSTVDAGKTRFAVTNAGTKKHNFAITGQGLDKQFYISLDPGDAKNLDVNLNPGRYTVLCPVRGHRAQESIRAELTAR